MTRSPDTELDALFAELKTAMTAELPNLVEIRRLRGRVCEYLACHVLKIMQGHGRDGPRGRKFDVIGNDRPVTGEPRGVCSPVKTDDIRRFEANVRQVFGNVGPCTTMWGGEQWH